MFAMPVPGVQLLVFRRWLDLFFVSHFFLLSRVCFSWLGLVRGRVRLDCLASSLVVQQRVATTIALF